MRSLLNFSVKATIFSSNAYKFAVGIISSSEPCFINNSWKNLSNSMSNVDLEKGSVKLPPEEEMKKTGLSSSIFYR